MVQLDAWDIVYLARHPGRPKTTDYIRAPFPDFIELYGDHCYGNDTVYRGGTATFHGRSVTVLTQSKGKTLEESIQRNFGMLHLEGYRKVIRLAKQTEKFHRPTTILVDTTGACPGEDAEECEQAGIITQCLAVFSEIRTPMLAIVLSEGGSDNILVSSAADHVMVLEYAIYSTLSPEDFASVPWKDEPRAAETAGVMGPTAPDLEREGTIDTVTAEPKDGTHICFNYVVKRL